MTEYDIVNLNHYVNATGFGTWCQRIYGLGQVFFPQVIRLMDAAAEESGDMTGGE